MIWRFVRQRWKRRPRSPKAPLALAPLALALLALLALSGPAPASASAQLLFGGAGGLLDTSLFELGPGSGDLWFGTEGIEKTRPGHPDQQQQLQHQPFMLNPFLQDLRNSLARGEKSECNVLHNYQCSFAAKKKGEKSWMNLSLFHDIVP